MQMNPQLLLEEQSISDQLNDSELTEENVYSSLIFNLWLYTFIHVEAISRVHDLPHGKSK
jgi:hypothetical protein